MSDTGTGSGSGGGTGRRWFRILAWIVAGLFSFVLLLLVATYFILKAPSVQRRILASVQEPLKAQGVDLEVGSLSVDLLAGVTLDNLHLRLKRPPEIEGDISLAALRLRYKIWPLLQKKLIIDEALLSQVEGEIHLNVQPSTEKKEETPPDPEGLTKLLDMLRNPPARVDIPSVALEKVKLHVLVNKAPMTIDLWLRDLGVETSINLIPGEAALALKGNLPIEVDLQSTDGLALKTKLAVKPDLKFNLKVQDQHLAWNLDLNALELAVGPLVLAQKSLEAALDLNLESFSFQSGIHLKHEGDVPKNGVKPEDIALPIDGSGDWKTDLKTLKLVQQALVPKGPKLPIDPKMEVFVGLNGSNSFAVSVPRDMKKIDQLDWKLEQVLNVLNLKVIQGKETVVASPGISLNATANGKDGKGSVGLGLDLKSVDLKGLKKPATIIQKLQADVDLSSGRKLDWKLEQTLNGKAWLKGDGKIADDGQILSSALTLDIKTFSDWQPLHPAFAQLYLAGWPALVMTNDTQVKHSMPVEEINGTNWESLTITTKLGLQLKQQETNKTTIAKFKQLDLNLTADTQGRAAKVDLKLVVDALQHKMIKKTADLIQELKADVDARDYIRAAIEAKTQLGKQEILKLAIKAQEKPKQMKVDSLISVIARPDLKNYMDGLDILNDIGVIHLQTKDDLQLAYNENHIADVKSWKPEHMNVAWDSAQTLTQDNGKAIKYRLAKGLTMKSNLKLKSAKVDLDTKVNVPSASVKDIADIEGANVLLKAQVVDMRTQDSMAVIVNGSAAKVALAGDDKKDISDLLQRASFQLRAQLQGKDRLTIPLIEAKLQETLLHFQGSGNATISSGRGGFQGFVSSTLPEGRNLAGLRGKGSLQLPFNITLYDKKVIALKAEPQFDKMSFSFGDISAQNLNGKISVHEELRIDEAGRIGFLYLDTQNPFARVDFENVDPYLGQKSQLSIDQIKIKHIELGPMVENFELRQNLILLNDLKINLLKGSALGRLFVDLHPARLQLGFLGRFSGIQPELLKEPARRKKKQNSEFDGRMAINFDIRKRLSTGRIDITSIGRDQLLSLLDLLDPNYEDPQMMIARRALQVAYPNLVAISMDQGLMDLQIGLGGIISQDIHVRSIPLTAFINANAGEQLSQIEKFLEKTGGRP